jgi:hypothetical protein
MFVVEFVTSRVSFVMLMVLLVSIATVVVFDMLWMDTM